MRWSVFSFLFLGCTWFSQSPSPDETSLITSSYRENQATLPASYALYRSQLISKLNYKISIDLTNKDFYSGSVKINFFLREPKDLSLDFTHGVIEDLKVNEAPKIPTYNQYFISLLKQDLRSGFNSINIRYRHAFGEHKGLIRFVDPSDKKIYIYSSIDNYGANVLWPCFDQPDLLSTVELIVKVPQDWQVISSSPNSAADYAGKGEFFWLFPDLKNINIQSLPLAAGHYLSWDKNIHTTTHNLILRFWARQSVAQRVLFDDWFLASKNGFIFYEKEFDRPFNLPKYEQVLVPGDVQSPLGGLASAFFNEKDFLVEGEKSYLQIRNLSQLTLEKIVKWWVGQNITPATWDDLWISQSFSTYMSYEALLRGTLFADADYLVLEKKYQPEEAKSVAGVFFWRQLRLSTEGFLLYLRRMLTQFNLGLMSSNDLFSFWQKVHKQDIKQIKNSETGKNLPFRLSYDCSKETSGNVLLKSEVFDKDFYYENLEIVVFRFDGPRIVEMKSTKIDIKTKEQPLNDLVGLSCARLAFILVDPQNRHFFSWKMDLRSLHNLKAHLHEIEDGKVRFYGWLLLKDAIYDKSLSVEEFFEVVDKSLLPTETFDGARVALLATTDFFKSQGVEVRKRWRKKFLIKEKEFVKNASRRDIQKIYQDFIKQLNNF